MTEAIYLDNNATTPVDPSVIEAMLPYFGERFGNASSKLHAYGWVASEAVALAREQVAGLIGAETKEVVFTSGATEAINMAVKGVARAYERKGRHIVTTPVEHKAVLDACKALERDGWSVSFVEVDENGLVRPETLAKTITDETALVCVIWANNETGVIQPIKALADVARERNALFMSDATQAVGKVPVNVEAVDLLACSAHKFYGPKGVGALYVSRRSPRVRVVPLLDGGGQEGGLRGGTLNTPGIVGMGRAAVIAAERLDEDSRYLAALRDRLEAGLTSDPGQVKANGASSDRLPQTSSLTIENVKASDLIARTRALAFSSGSACSSGADRPSHVLEAMGLSREDALSTVRISLGRMTRPSDIDTALSALSESIRTIRGEAVSAVSPRPR